MYIMYELVNKGIRRRQLQGCYIDPLNRLNRDVRSFKCSGASRMPFDTRSFLATFSSPTLTPFLRSSTSTHSPLSQKKMAETKKVKSPQDFASLYILTIILFTR